MLYENLADDLAAQIQAGTFRPGERMPSVRQLASQQNVSVSTAVSAYQSLEAQGLINPRSKSGFYVSLPTRASLAAPTATRGLKPTQLNMSDTIAEIFRKTRRSDYVHFDLAVPHPAYQPATQLKAATNRVVRHHFEKSLQLSPSPGDLELRRLIAQRMTSQGSQLSPDDIVITNGCQEAILISLQAITSPGDVVAVEMPCYYGFLQALESLGLKVVSVATDPISGLDIEALEKVVTRWPVKACLCSPNFSNPTGGQLSQEGRRSLLHLAQEFDFFIIEDDIFGELAHDGSSGNSLLAMAHQLARKNRRLHNLMARVIYCSAFSKSLSPGLRLGWVVAGEQRLRVMERQRAATTGSTSLIQLQVADYLKSGHFDKHLARVRREYQRNVLKSLQVIADAFPIGTQATQPCGGFVLWLSLPETGIDASQLFQRALNHNICFVPGEVFGLAGLSHCLRLSVAQPWTEPLDQALRQLGALAQA
ncbi:MAG: PLP-dependent aminotransferase family protein [Cellvibrionaceae bacterium]